jgi:hypothetical protein
MCFLRGDATRSGDALLTARAGTPLVAKAKPF